MQRYGNERTSSMMSLLRIYATNALVPSEDIKNKCVPFAMFVLMLICPHINLLLVFKSLLETSHNSAFKPLGCLSGSLK